MAPALQPPQLTIPPQPSATEPHTRAPQTAGLSTVQAGGLIGTGLHAPASQNWLAGQAPASEPHSTTPSQPSSCVPHWRSAVQVVRGTQRGSVGSQPVPSALHCWPEGHDPHEMRSPIV